MPFDLKDATFSLSYMMDNILVEFKKAKLFFDECILYRERIEGIDLLQKVLQKFVNYGIYISYTKYEFIVTKCNFVGHVVNSNEVKPQTSRISGVANFNRPNSLAELRTFLGWQLIAERLLLTF